MVLVMQTDDGLFRSFNTCIGFICVLPSRSVVRAIGLIEHYIDAYVYITPAAIPSP